MSKTPLFPIIGFSLLGIMSTQTTTYAQRKQKPLPPKQLIIPSDREMTREEIEAENKRAKEMVERCLEHPSRRKLPRGTADQYPPPPPLRPEEADPPSTMDWLCRIILKGLGLP